MRTSLHLLLTAGCWAALLLPAAQAQSPKPDAWATAKPAAKPRPKTSARPVAKPAAKPTAKPAAPVPVVSVQSAPAPAPTATPAPVAAPAPTAKPAATGPFGVGSGVVNLGLGVGSRYSYGLSLFGGTSSVMPALSFSYERGILPLGPGVLGVGGIVGYQSASYEYSGFKDRYTDIIVMVRGLFHYPVSDRFDAYGGVGLGVRHVGYSSNYTGPYATDYGSTGATSGLVFGGRYFLTPGIGAFAELGYDQTYLKAGLSAKF